MARIPYPNLDDLDPEVGAFMKRIDPMINVFHMMAHAETAVRPERGSRHAAVRAQDR